MGTQSRSFISFSYECRFSNSFCFDIFLPWDFVIIGRIDYAINSILYSWVDCSLMCRKPLHAFFTIIYEWIRVVILASCDAGIFIALIKLIKFKYRY